MKTEAIAKVCHEANRAYCSAIGDDSQLPWESAPEWARASAIKGVEFTLANPLANPIDSHESWLKEKRETGWKYGPVKDPEKKEHPCFVAYDELPSAQRAKDHLFQATVKALAPFLLMLLAFLPGLALAQEAPVEVKVGVTDLKNEFLRVFVQYLLVPIAVGMAGVVTWVLVAARKWLEAKAGDSLMGKSVMKLDDVLLAVVHDLEANGKADLRAAAEDGVITSEEFAKLKEIAIGRTKAILGEQGIEALKGAMGFGAAQLEQYLSGKLEGAVAAVSLNAAKTAALAAPSPK